MRNMRVNFEVKVEFYPKHSPLSATMCRDTYYKRDEQAAKEKADSEAKAMLSKARSFKIFINDKLIHAV